MYKVSNTFEIFGDPCHEYHKTREQAETAAQLIASQIVELFFGFNAHGKVVVEPREGRACGFAVEVELMDTLADMSEQMGGIPAEWVVEEVRDAAIEIESV